MISVPQEIQSQLSSGEHVLWSGQPRQGVVLRGSDAFMIPFSLMWGGFAVFWEASVISSNAPAFFVLWGVPFVLVGVYLIIGRFFAEAKQRARTFYAVTNERILIVSGLFTRKVKSLNLRTLSDLSLSEGKGNRCSISFGGGSPFASMFGGFSGWPGMEAHLGPRFDLIENAKAVYETIRKTQRGTA
jgi:Bacterial PH domain